jgi:hypothetical protein
MYYSPGHDWYYVKDLGDDEILMFVQKDSDKAGGGGKYHTLLYSCEFAETQMLKLILQALRTRVSTIP